MFNVFSYKFNVRNNVRKNLIKISLLAYVFILEQLQTIMKYDIIIQGSTKYRKIMIIFICMKIIWMFE